MTDINFLQQFGIVGFVVLQIIFVSVIGWLLFSVKSFKKELHQELVALDSKVKAKIKDLSGYTDRQVQSFDGRIDKLEVKDAVRDETISNFMKVMNTINSKLDLILDPKFFERCPYTHKGDKK